MANVLQSDSSHVEDKSNLSVTVSVLLESAGTIVAAGSTQGTAAAVIHAIEWVTGADGTKGVILPATRLGLSVMIKNDSALALKVYPTGAVDIINLLASATPIAMAAASSATFACTSAGQWHTFPTVPS